MALQRGRKSHEMAWNKGERRILRGAETGFGTVEIKTATKYENNDSSIATTNITDTNTNTNQY